MEPVMVEKIQSMGLEPWTASPAGQPLTFWASTELMSTTGWPGTLENRENGEKNSLQGKIREFEILLKIREKSGNLKKSYLCKVKIFKFYSCSDVATDGFFLPYV